MNVAEAEGGSGGGGCGGGGVGGGISNLLKEMNTAIDQVRRTFSDKIIDQIHEGQAFSVDL